MMKFVQENSLSLKFNEKQTRAIFRSGKMKSDEELNGIFLEDEELYFQQHNLLPRIFQRI